VPGRDVLACGRDVPALIVRNRSRLEGLQELALVQAAEKQSFVYRDVPVHQCTAPRAHVRARFAP